MCGARHMSLYAWLNGWGGLVKLGSDAGVVRQGPAADGTARARVAELEQALRDLDAKVQCGMRVPDGQRGERASPRYRRSFALLSYSLLAPPARSCACV